MERRRNCWQRVVPISAAVALALVGAARGGSLSTFETGTLEGWTVDAGAGPVTLTPDNSTSSEGTFSLRIDVASGGFHFGSMRYDQGAVNPHHPEWLPPNSILLFDVRVGTFTDFLSIRSSYIPSGAGGAGGTVNGPDVNIHTVSGWQTVQWDYPEPGSGSEVPPVPPFWIEWFSTNSNGAHTLWIDNIRTAPIPEPTALLMLPVVGGLIARRRARS